MLNKLLVIFATSMIGLVLICGYIAGAPVATYSAPTAKDKSALLTALNKVHVKCPSFFDAPLGNKPCPAQERLDALKAIANHD